MKKLVWLQIAIVCVMVISLCQMSYSQSHIVPFLASSSAEFGTNKAAPPSPGVRADGANKFWITIEDMTYVIGDTNERIVVPKGFVTDYASIPEKLWSLGLSPHGRYSRAAVVHDYLYWSQGCTKTQADRLLVIAMKESNVGDFDESVIYLGVKIGGEGPWNKNAVDRKAGLPKVVPEKYLRPADPNIDWPMYREMLFMQGVRDPPFEKNPSYCVYGNTTEVP